MSEYFAESDTGLVYMANGYNAILRWDGFSQQMETAGIAAPSKTPTVTGSGTGAIVGDYYAYVRFYDRFNNFSDLSPISVVYTPEGDSGTITGASNATPIVITSTAHGLANNATVKITGVLGNTSANNTWTILVVDADSFELVGSNGTADYDSGGEWVSGVSTITYGNLDVPSDPKIVARQILRNTDGQTDTFYVDIDTTNLSSPTLSSTRVDDDLAAQESLSILDADGNPLANIHGVPPNHKPYLAFHLNRMFYAGQRDYKRGNVQVTMGSTTVTGVGTDWVGTFSGRFLSVVDASQEYEISSVDVPNQTLTLTEAYKDGTTLFGVYAIRPANALRRLVFWSESGLPESVPPLNALSIPENGDEITGLMVRGSFLYVLEKRHIWKITFQDDPATDLGLFPASERGCINNRCWVRVDDVAYMLDEQGIHMFEGGVNSDQVSQPIQDIFRPQTISDFRIAWDQADLFHAVHYRPEETIRWFVCLSGSLWPRHSLSYNYRLRRWWLEEYPIDISASTWARLGDIPYVFLGSEAEKVLAMQSGVTDITSPSLGPVRGTVTAATVLTLSDTLSSFASSVVNAPVAIVEGKGIGQQRRVVSNSSGVLTIDRPWNILPDTTSTYQIGGVRWQWKSGWFRFGTTEQMADRRLELVHEPLTYPSNAILRWRHDFSTDYDRMALRRDRDRDAGVRSRPTEESVSLDLTRSIGVVQQRYPGNRENFAPDGKRFVQVDLSGDTNQDRVAIYGIIFEGASNPSAQE